MRPSWAGLSAPTRWWTSTPMRRSDVSYASFVSYLPVSGLRATGSGMGYFSHALAGPPAGAVRRGQRRLVGGRTELEREHAAGRTRDAHVALARPPDF